MGEEKDKPYKLIVPLPDKAKFWNISASNLLTIAALFVYWYLSRNFCLNELQTCYDGWNTCRMEKFPNASAISLNFSDYKFNATTTTLLNVSVVPIAS